MTEPATADVFSPATEPETGVNVRRVAIRAMAVLIVAQTAAGLFFIAGSLNGTVPDSWGFRGFQAIVAGLLLVLGVLVTTRRSDNTIGWLFLITGYITSFQMMAGEYSRYALVVEGSASALADWASWIESWVWVPIMAGLSVGLFSTFPDGRLPSRRWRWVVVVGAAGAAVLSLAAAVAPTPDTTPPPAFRNPIGLAGQESVVGIVFALGFFALVSAMFIALIALILRLRRADGAERKQLEWVTAASVLVPISLVVYAAFPSKLTETLQIVSLLAIPAAAGVAILRYRLYDIDLIISRTLVYVPLTAFLAGLYSASVALFQKVFQAVTGDRSDAAIIISALVLAAVFTPAKSWLQAEVDHRFKPDADPDRRLRAFGDEVAASVYRVDPERLSRRLVAQVRLATRAESVSWVIRVGAQRIQEDSGETSTQPVAVSLPITVSGAEGELRLGGRPSGRPYAASELMALTGAAEAVARAIVDAADLAPARAAGQLETAESL